VDHDLRANKHFTLKTRPLKRNDRQDFIDCYHPAYRQRRKETERFKYFDYKTLVARDKASLEIFWLKDGSLDNLDNLDDLPAPDMLAQEIVEHLEAALASFRAVAAALPRSAETRWRALQGASKIPFSVGAHPVRDALRSRRARASRTGCAPTR
jgi:type I restriction enzyme M protein